MKNVSQEAERATITLLLKRRLCDIDREYLPHADDTVWTVEDACIVATRVRNRTGVPADAISYRYRVTHPDGWEVEIRAVWRGREVWRPATHVVVETYEGEDDAASSRAQFCDWLQGL